MSKIIYLDTETTGLDKEKNDIVQVAGIIEIDGVEKEKFDFKCQPFDWNNVSQDALDIQGRTIEELKTYPKPQDTYKEFIKILSKYVDKFNKNDKFYIAGQNVKFDLDFLHSWAKKCGDKYLGSFFYWYCIDLLVLASAFRAWGFIDTPTLKLCDICNVLDVNIENAHDAMADIKATKMCLGKIKTMFKFELSKTDEKLFETEEEIPF